MYFSKCFTAPIKTYFLKTKKHFFQFFSKLELLEFRSATPPSIPVLSLPPQQYCWETISTLRVDPFSTPIVGLFSMPIDTQDDGNDSLRHSAVTGAMTIAGKATRHCREFRGSSREYHDSLLTLHIIVAKLPAKYICMRTAGENSDALMKSARPDGGRQWKYMPQGKQSEQRRD
jgi:hypothetical protein